MRCMFILYHDINVDGRSKELLECASLLGDTIFVSYKGIEEVNNNAKQFIVCNGKRNYIRFVFEASKIIRQQKPDILFLQNMYDAPLIKVAKRSKHDTVVIYDASELYISGVKPSRRTIKQKLSVFIKMAEEKNINMADVILTPTIERSYILQGYYSLSHTPIVFDNIHKLTETIDTSKCKTRYDEMLKNKFVIVYGGGIADSRYTFELCDAVHSLKEDYFMIITGAAGKDELHRFNEWKKTNQNKNVLYLGMLKKDEWRFLLQNAKISISAYKFYDMNLIFCASGKVFEGLFEGVPLLASLNPPFYNLCQDEGVGISTDDFASGIKNIRENYEMFKTNVQIYINKLHYSNRIIDLKEKIDKLICLEQEN